MANYKRKCCRHLSRVRRDSQTHWRQRCGLKPVKLTDWHWNNVPLRILWPPFTRRREDTPSSWNITHHTRPRRTKEKRISKAILNGIIDVDEVIWPLSKKPHIYYW